MHFIPNPNNTEFIYLLGLEAVVDRLTQGVDHPPPPIPFICSQCGTDFSSLWKWDKAATRKTQTILLDSLQTEQHQPYSIALFLVIVLFRNKTL